MPARLTALATALLTLAGTAGAQDIRVSSKIDTEGGLLGNMILLALSAADMPVQDRLQLGGTPILRDAITSGQVDIYPEYTANGAFFFNEGDSDVWKDAQAGYERVAQLDLEQNDITWLTPSPANNTWAVATRRDLADENGLTTMSELGEWIASGGDVKLAASTEFVTSPAALPAFQETYGFQLRPDQLVQLSGGDTAATIAAAAQQTSGVNAAMVYGTDGGIAPAGLVVMEDDKAVQPVYQPAPIIRTEVLESYPQIAEVLEPIFRSLDLETLQELNGRIQIGGEPAASVARDYLTAQGFIAG
ncbi:ABC transporter substrate-binding protein [Paracoccus sp. 1_MG-2023]|uniref:glycine betaine ABC transporter substrate-binding protein OsmF n=1 Tax=unclassified Paracoccus (in: a-proteobacteria) TaxID=2688777 RepID=UPI001C0826AF|nr:MULTISPECIES: ABC transporter substrate-binding protein [unclassified Paracoccus (in: a-proteobacteria)]MBU2956220.1 ABC transporter substrate-binding protein [Paracoccus sp. C2R09]MDO6667897.1 ABC transporter substrate-binding protein [Paracoccus sp. 1_MG-2023]